MTRAEQDAVLVALALAGALALFTWVHRQISLFERSVAGVV